MLLVFLGISLLGFSQYDITFKFADISSEEVQVGYRYGDKTYISDTIFVNKKGVAHFSGKEKLPGGIYLMIYGKKDFYEFLITKDQEFTLSTTTQDPVKQMEVKGSKENELFFSSQKYLAERRQEINRIQADIEKAEKGSKKEKSLNARLDSLKEVLDAYWKDIVQKHPDTFYATLLEANNGNEGAFFDNVDFSDERLLRTPVIYTTMRVNMARDLNAHKKPETIIKHTDQMIEKSMASEEVFKYVLMYHLSFYNSFSREGIHKVFVHLADKYVDSGKADWLDSTQVEGIMKKANAWRSSFAGNIAPDIEAQTPEGELKSLHNTGSAYTLLFFWKTGCGHCEDAAEVIREFYNKEKMDLAVYSFYTKKNKQQWTDYLNEHDLTDWINVYDPERESNYQNLYYVASTPLLFLLDEDNRILARKAGDTAIEKLIKQLEEQRHKFSLE